MTKDAEEMGLYKTEPVMEQYSNNVWTVRGPRGSGKTEKLLRDASINGGMYVTVNNAKVDYARRLCKEMGIDPPAMCTYADLTGTGKHAWTIAPLYLDDVGLFVSEKFRSVVCIAL